MKMNLRISVVVPSYQQAEFLPRTLDSLVLQEGVKLEVLIQDGGSTDGSVEIIKRYAEKYPNLIKWESKKDGGQSAGINIGLRKATGDIVGYLNSDDVLHPDALKYVVDYFHKNPEAMAVYGLADHTDEEDKYIGDYPTKEWDYQELLRGCFICQPACFWRKEVMERYGLFDESLHYSMDYEYWLRIGRKDPIHFLPIKLASSRCHSLAKRFDAETKVREEAMNTAAKYNNGKVSILWIASLAKLKASSWLSASHSTYGIIRFCLSYWRHFFALLYKANDLAPHRFLQKLIPPLKSAWKKRDDPFFHIR